MSNNIGLLDIMSMGNEQEFFELRMYPDTNKEFRRLFVNTHSSLNTFVNYLLLIAVMDDVGVKDIHFTAPVKGKGLFYRTSLRTTKHILQHKDKIVAATTLTDTQVINHLLRKGMALHENTNIILALNKTA